MRAPTTLALSVVTPVFNSRRYLPATLESVARLSVSHEHIVIDGGSEDGTVELLRARDDQSLVWISEPDRGQTDAVNKGLRRARGLLIGWINGDDELIPAAVDRAVAYLLENPGVDAVFGGLHITDEEGRVRRTYKPGVYSWRRYLFLGDYIPTTATIFRQELLDRVGVLDEQYVDAADYDFYLRLFKDARVERLPDVLVRFRFHPESKTARDAFRGQREAMQIRLKWARGPGDRALMWTIDFLKRAVLPRISPWPRLYA